MASSSSFPLLLFLLTMSWPSISLGSGGRATFGFDIHHRYSDNVRRWAESMAWIDTGNVWPEKGSLHYYASLVAHDKSLLHRRGLAEGGGGPPPTLTFEDGNATVRLDLLGLRAPMSLHRDGGGKITTGISNSNVAINNVSLHYANVSIGTPRVNFLVALDTGSNLFWVPCDCKACAPTSNQDYELKFSIYNSSLSSTSKMVPCSSNLCELQSQCNSSSDACPYTVEYLSPNLSTSGVLLEDLLYLTTDDAQHEAVKSNITFGCSVVQTGGFLDSAAPNGLLGLSMDSLSVPSILASEGLTSNSFSMCFGEDGLGRINFGDKGSQDQNETPFDLNIAKGELYVVKIIGLDVGSTSMVGNAIAIIDSGTSMTTLTEPLYSNITMAFDSQTEEQPLPPIQGNPFEYCYDLRIGQTSINIPLIRLTMDGGSDFPFLHPIIILRLSKTRYIYCLAIVKNDNVNVNIIGQNFMTGHRIVFDREKLVLGWTESNCYDINNSTVLSKNTTKSSPTAPPTTSQTVIPTLPSMPFPPSNLGHSLGPFNSLVAGLCVVLLFFIM